MDAQSNGNGSSHFEQNSNGQSQQMNDNKIEIVNSSNSEKTPVIINLSKTFNHWGFQGCLEHIGTRRGLRQLVAINANDTLRRSQDAKALFDIRIQRLHDRVKELNDALEADNNAKGSSQKLEDIWNELHKTYIEFGEKKGLLIEQRIADFKKEVSALTDAQGTFYGDMRALNKRMFEDNQPSLDVRKSRAETLRSQIVSRQDEVDKQLKTMTTSGISSDVFEFLTSKGHFVALIAGWFFSVFMLVQNTKATADPSFGAEDVWFFMINSIHNSLGFEGGQATVNNVFFAIGKILFVIFTIGLISFICQWLLDRFSQKKDNVEQIEIILLQDDNLDDSHGSKAEIKNITRLGLKIQADSWFTFWLHTVPFLTIAGFVFLILRIGVSHEDIAKLDLSLTGQFIGMALAYGLAGLTHLFVAKNQDLVIRKEWGYVLLAAFLLIPFLFVVKFFPSDIHLSYKIISMVGFVFSAFLAAFLFSYGVRYRGLQQLSDEMNRMLDTLTVIISRYTSPKFVNLFDQRYPQKIQDMEKDLLMWIYKRNEKAQLLQGIEPESYKNKSKKRKDSEMDWFSRVRSYITSNGKSSEQTGFDTNEDDHFLFETFTLSQLEKEHFPLYDKKIEALTKAYNEERKRQGRFFRSISDLNEKITNTRSSVAELSRLRNESIYSIQLQGFHQELWIREGYELGLWYIRNDLYMGFLPFQPDSDDTLPPFVAAIIPPFEPESVLQEKDNDVIEEVDIESSELQNFIKNQEKRAIIAPNLDK